MRTLCVRSAAFSALLALSVCAPSAFAQDAKIEQAKTHMQAGAAFYNDPSGRKCEEAYREFSKAYELSGSLNALKGMGVCALELERDGEAIEYLSKFLAGKKDQLEAEEKAQVENDIAALNSAVAWITISASEDGVKLMDVRTPTKGFPIRNRYDVGTAPTRLGIHPGSHSFEARNASGETQTWNIDLANGSTLDHAFDFGGSAAAVVPLAPPPGGPTPGQPPPGQPDEVADEDNRPIPTTVYIFGGLTVALVIPTVIFMASASGARSDFDDQNGSASAAELDDLRGDVTTMNLVADVFLGATVASAAATAIFYFTRPTVDSQTGSYWTVAPAVSRDGGGAAMFGAF